MEPTSAKDEMTKSCEEATAEFCGSLVRLDCGTEEGVYQGVVLKVDPTNAHITIENPFRNGVSLGNQVIQIPGQLIKEVLVVRMPHMYKHTKQTTAMRLRNAKMPPLNSNAAPFVPSSQKHMISTPSVSTQKPLPNSQQTKTNNQSMAPRKKKPREQLTKKDDKRDAVRNATNNLKETQKKSNDLSFKDNKEKREQPTAKKDIIRNSTSNTKKILKKTNELNPKDTKEKANVKREQPVNKKEPKKNSASDLEEIQKKANELSLKEQKETQEMPKETASSVSDEPNKAGFIGCLASVYSSDSSDIYQGKIMSVDVKELSVRLEKPFLNGRPLPIPFIDIPGKMMKDIRVVRGPSPVPAQEGIPTNGRHSMGSIPPHRRPPPVDSVRSENFKRLSPPNMSSPAASSIHTPMSHQNFGEFKLFKEQQQTTPMNVQVNHRRNIHGPTGIPAIDCLNGYRTYSDRFEEPNMGDQRNENWANRSAEFRKKRNGLGHQNRDAQTQFCEVYKISCAGQAAFVGGSSPMRAHCKEDRPLTGRHSTGSMPPQRRSSPANSVRSEHIKRLSPLNMSSISAASTRAPLNHQTFGEFKLFREQQQAIPMRLQVNHRRNVHGEYGPTGIPAIDCSNGYRSYTDRYAESIMGDPLDPNMNTDFDFAGNLALFDKAEFNRETEHIFQGLDSAGDCSRNYRNDENVLQDSARVISWTKNENVHDDDNNQNTSTSSPVD